jgi:hypothetical protein
MMEVVDSSERSANSSTTWNIAEEVTILETSNSTAVVRVSGNKSRGPGSILGATRFSEK